MVDAALDAAVNQCTGVVSQQQQQQQQQHHFGGGATPGNGKIYGGRQSHELCLTFATFVLRKHTVAYHPKPRTSLCNSCTSASTEILLH